MMSLLLALPKIAAERGDGLRPELLRLLENPKTEKEAAKRIPEITPAATEERKDQPTQAEDTALDRVRVQAKTSRVGSSTQGRAHAQTLDDARRNVGHSDRRNDGG